MENINQLFENNIEKITSLKKLSGGLSNDIYLINKSFIWKVIKNKYLFDHKNEIDIMKSSSSFILYYYDDFNICYNFINGINITLDDYQNNLELVINKTKEYHEIKVKTYNFWKEVVPKWLNQIKEDKNIIKIYTEISKEMNEINDINDLVLCHHDIHSANIIKNEDGYNLIDLEFSFVNYYYADLGNIICEYFTDYNKEIYNYDKIDDTIKLKVINLYFNDIYKNLEECPLILKKINIGIKMSHFYWFLWGKLVAKNESSKEFDYLKFSNCRLDYLN